MYFYICLSILFVACNADNAAPAKSSICTSGNGYYQTDNSCDSYVECRDYQAVTHTCPDGLHFDPKATWPVYPCGYPMDVQCVGRNAVQPAQPTADCPHQYGFYPHPQATPDNCGQYRMCVAGTAINMLCPPALAFNPATSRCDWPDQVPSCNSDAFLGFKCPATPLNAEGKPSDQIYNYKYEGNCYYFFACEKGKARLLSCDSGLAFDSGSGTCVDDSLVQCQVSPNTVQAA
ncbi:hypothetical protein K1T71_003151 [Dendrolimus kikuchii]|uniref:Uncharacterized protein n=1 Tax=Dendrolimus kikuchii TaxID=765133 RepID=A0ACC1DBP6_9NEOP|nr:hypothetical protein K1T71_003151 [Dendrolimus kikuchii]